MRRPGRRWSLVAGLGAAVSVLASAPDARAQRPWGTPADRDAAEARELMGSGRCDSALAAFDRAIAQRPKDAELRRDRGLCHDELGAVAPAIEDFRAYLSMKPKAKDAFRIQTRLDELEREHLPKSKAPDHDGDGRVDKTKTPEDLEDPFAIEEEDDSGVNESRVVDRSSFLLGLYLGFRDWSSKGFASPTTSIGGMAAFDPSPDNEIFARLGYLKTGGGGNLGDASGFEVTAGYALLFGLDSARQFDAVAGLAAGLELQSTELKTSTNFITVRALASARWNASEAIALQAGPEVGAGILSRGARVDADDRSDFALYYGGVVSLLWRLGGGEAEAPPPNTAPDPDAKPDRDPDEPLSEDELWDD